jgi:hypothetical protein
MVPEEGPYNPIFERLDLSDTLHVTMLFAAPLGDAMLDRVEAIAFDWFAKTSWAAPGEEPATPQLEDERLTPTCLHLAITNVTTAKSPVADLIAALEMAKVGLHQVILGRRGPNKMRSTLLSLMDPTATRQTRYDDPRSWWSACFDLSCPPPLSEDLGELFIDENTLLEGKKTTFAEYRGLPLHVAGVRICYGMVDFEFAPDESDRRTLDVTRVFRTALDSRFNGFWREPFEGTMRPAPYNLKQQRDGALDRIRRDGRVGYSCVFTTRDLREFLHGNVFRYREYELMLALRDTVRALDLEPVVCWRRFTRRYVVQMWERKARAVHCAA